MFLVYSGDLEALFKLSLDRMNFADRHAMTVYMYTVDAIMRQRLIKSGSVKFVRSVAPKVALILKKKAEQAQAPAYGAIIAAAAQALLRAKGIPGDLPGGLPNGLLDPHSPTHADLRVELEADHLCAGLATFQLKQVGETHVRKWISELPLKLTRYVRRLLNPVK
jgi:hypothetical protein